MNRERPLTPYKEIREFLRFLYEDREGFSYAPTKIPETKIWEEHYFEWPRQEAELIKHIRDRSPSFEVYLSPALFRSPSAKKSAFASSGVVWVEFDGEIPRDLSGLPAPSRIIRSSSSDHQHWYWKLAGAITDADMLETFTKKVVYALRGDLGTWNCNRVLRPVKSKHHESGKEVLDVSKGRVSEGFISDSFFYGLPDAPEGISTGEAFKGEIPSVEEVIRKYPIPDNLWNRINLARPDDASESLCFVAYKAAEMSCTDAEIFSLLLHVDEKWGKYKGRSDRIKRLTDILDRAKIKRPITVHESGRFRIQGLNTLLKSEEVVEWAIPGLIHKQGVGIVTAQPGVGKTQLSLRAALATARGDTFLGWEIPEPQPILFVSLEMSAVEIKDFLTTMTRGLSEEEFELLEQNFKVVTFGESVMLEREDHQQYFRELVEETSPVGVFIDSLSYSIGKSPNDDEAVHRAMYFVRRLNRDFGTFTWFVHHDRKPQVNNKKPTGLADIYGSQFIERDITTGMNLWSTNPSDSFAPIELSCTKLRMGTQFSQKIIKRTDTLNFELVHDEAVVPQEGDNARSRDRSGSGTEGNTGGPSLSF